MLSRWLARLILKVASEIEKQGEQQDAELMVRLGGLETEIAVPFGFGPGTDKHDSH